MSTVDFDKFWHVTTSTIKICSIFIIFKIATTPSQSFSLSVNYRLIFLFLWFHINSITHDLLCLSFFTHLTCFENHPFFACTIVQSLFLFIAQQYSTVWLYQVRNIPWTREWLPTPVFLPGNSMDRGAWWAAVQGVAKSWTQLSD